MHSGAVIALRIIFKHQLPVRAHVVLDPFRRLQDRHVPMRKFSLQRRKPTFQAVAASLCRGVPKIHKNESLPDSEVHSMQWIIGLLESGHIFHMRRANQAAVESIGPCMIRTLNGHSVSAGLLFQPRPAMTANIKETVNLSALIPNNN